MATNILGGDCLDLLLQMGAESIDAVVTDPPYGLGFMGKDWDHGVPGPHFWREVLRVAKPGAHLVAMGGTRTHHRLMCAVEDAGWEIRDCLMWLYGSGFPKSHNLKGDHNGWGTALKPAWEPIVLARKPLVGTVAANVAAHGAGALNIDGCRIAPTGEHVGGSHVSTKTEGWDRPWKHNAEHIEAQRQRWADADAKATALGRWPANVVLDEDAAAMLDEQTPDTGRAGSVRGDEPSLPGYSGGLGRVTFYKRADERGGASRFFYCAKASRAEREAGLDALPERLKAASGGAQGAEARGEDYDAAQGIGLNRVQRMRNHHPTVKPVALMRWLVRLVTPPDGIVLDPFMGSGTTGVACEVEGFDFVGIERDPRYVAIAEARIGCTESGQPTLWRQTS